MDTERDDLERAISALTNRDLVDLHYQTTSQDAPNNALVRKELERRLQRIGFLPANAQPE